jgi:CheY-like chemotaxis protein
MVVEDNILHQEFLRPVFSVNGLTPFKAAPEGGDGADIREQSGYYGTAERALARIEHAIRTQEALPQAILCDIELGDPRNRMNGLQLAERIHERLTEAGRRGEVVVHMLYSSNLRFYEERVQALEANGVISGHMHKDHFSITKLIESINASWSARHQA